MSITMSITSKGQVTIPKAYRDNLGLDKSRKATLSLNKSGQIVISKPKTLADVRASLAVPSHKDPTSPKEAAIGKALAKKYGVD